MSSLLPELLEPEVVAQGTEKTGFFRRQRIMSMLLMDSRINDYDSYAARYLVMMRALLSSLVAIGQFLRFLCTRYGVNPLPVACLTCVSDAICKEIN